MTVINIKLEQSDLRTETAGSLPGRVPVTPLAQLSALHSLRAKMLDKTPLVRPRAKMQYRTFIFATADGKMMIYLYI